MTLPGLRLVSQKAYSDNTLHYKRQNTYPNAGVFDNKELVGKVYFTCSRAAEVTNMSKVGVRVKTMKV